MISYFELSVYPSPSLAVLTQYAMFLFFFIFGYLSIRIFGWGSHARVMESSSIFKINSFRIKFVMHIVSFSCLFVLIFSLKVSGGLSTNFNEYFFLLRSYELDSYLTGNKYLDLVTKIIVYPVTFSMIVLIFSVGTKRFKTVFFVSLLNLILFAYLWQVNYPIISLFWVTIFSFILHFKHGFIFQGKIFLLLLFIISLLVFSSVNRFGGDLLGAIKHYFISYHVTGFSFYDYQYNNPDSILHVHTYGRSSLGFIDQLADLLARMIGLDYKAASFENIDFNAYPVDVGAVDGRKVNAFGTFLFSLYRDFNLIGIAVGGYLYGAFATYTLLLSNKSWLSRALFIVLASSWMIGMMVSPLEQGFFWFAILFVGLLKVINRGFRFGSSYSPINKFVILKNEQT